MSDEEIGLLDEDKDKDQIRSELSEMSFEDLQKLKEKLGTKVYNAAVFGPKKVRKVEFKRENKNRPREMSAKKPVPRFKDIVRPKKHIPRDPRFDSLCGTFDPKIFKKAYGFLSETKRNDIQQLKTELQETDDPKMIKKIKYLVQRLENQLREEQRSNEKEQKVQEEKKELMEAIKRGEKPNFKKKSDKKMLDLISQYEGLKSSGKLQKHIERLRKKNLRRDRKKLSAPDTK